MCCATTACDEICRLDFAAHLNIVVDILSALNASDEPPHSHSLRSSILFITSLRGDQFCRDSPALRGSGRALRRRNQATEQVRHTPSIPPLGLSASARQLSAEPRSLLDRRCRPVPRQCRSLIAPIGTFAVGCWGSFGQLSSRFSISESTALEPNLFHLLSQLGSYRTRVCG